MRKKGDILPIPNFDLAVTSPCDKPPLAAQIRLTTDQTATRHCRRPAHSIDTCPMRLKDLTRPIAFLKFQYADFTIAGGAREQTSRFVGRPADYIDRRCVKSEISHFRPLRGLLAPNEDFAIVGGGS